MQFCCDFKLGFCDDCVFFLFWIFIFQRGENILKKSNDVDCDYELANYATTVGFGWRHDVYSVKIKNRAQFKLIT